MIRWIALLLIAVPAVEIWCLVQVGSRIGSLPTLLLLVASGIAGAWLMRREGRKAWTDVKHRLQQGQPPGHAMLNGLCVLAGGVLLMLPGFLSDVIGLTLLLPITRPFYRGILLRWLEKRLRNGSFTIIRRK